MIFSGVHLQNMRTFTFTLPTCTIHTLHLTIPLQDKNVAYLCSAPVFFTHGKLPVMDPNY